MTEFAVGHHQPVAEEEEQAVVCPGCAGVVVEFLWVVKNEWYCSQRCASPAAYRCAAQHVAAETNAMLPVA